MLILEIVAGVVLGGVVLFVLHSLFLLWVEGQEVNLRLRQEQAERDHARLALEQARRDIGTGAPCEAWPDGLRPDPTGQQRFADTANL